MTFTHLGEQWLDKWMEENAFVCCFKHPSPWDVEATMLEALPLPLNIQDNAHHPFSRELRRLRKEAIALALQEPIAREENQRRRMQVGGYPNAPRFVQE